MNQKGCKKPVELMEGIPPPSMEFQQMVMQELDQAKLRSLEALQQQVDEDALEAYVPYNAEPNSAIKANGYLPVTPENNKDIVLCLAVGMTIPETAEHLDLNLPTLRGRVAYLRKKMKAKSVAHLVAIFFDKGIIKPSVSQF